MACGWFLALMLATMPLFGVSDYRKFAICLPFEIGDSISLGKKSISSYLGIHFLHSASKIRIKNKRHFKTFSCVN